nr:MarR family transcriptional regulator [uncultured Oscillibacter sp.]
MEQSLLPDGSVEAFRAVSKEFDTIYTRFAKVCGLSEAEFWSLLMIRGGATTQTEISDQLFLSRQTVNSAFKLLVKKGLVRLEPLEHNQRTKQVLLTQSGERFMERRIDRMLDAEQQAWQAMEERERALLTRLTRKYAGLVRTALEQAPTTIESSSSEDLSS